MGGITCIRRRLAQQPPCLRIFGKTRPGMVAGWLDLVCCEISSGCWFGNWCEVTKWNSEAKNDIQQLKIRMPFCDLFHRVSLELCSMAKDFWLGNWPILFSKLTINWARCCSWTIHGSCGWGFFIIIIFFFSLVDLMILYNIYKIQVHFILLLILCT